MIRQGPILLPILVVVAAMAAAAAAGDAAPKPEAAKAGAAELHAKMVKAYLGGQWEELAAADAKLAAQMDALTAEQREEIEYVREAAATCRPAWWKACKTGRRRAFNVTIWGRKFPVRFVPAEEPTWRAETTGNILYATVSWDPAKMDSPRLLGESAEEDGPTEGDMAEITVWEILGNIHLTQAIESGKLTEAYNRDKLRFQQYGVFRNKLISFYHCSPHARRTALAIHLTKLSPQYGAGPAGRPYRAVASMLVAEVLADPARYPSFPLPDAMPKYQAETATGLAMKQAAAAGWTLAEDRRLREAVRRFAEANDELVLKEGKVVLPNGLAFMFDEDADLACQDKRDEWVKQRLQKRLGAETGD